MGHAKNVLVQQIRLSLIGSFMVSICLDLCLNTEDKLYCTSWGVKRKIIEFNYEPLDKCFA